MKKLKLFLVMVASVLIFANAALACTCIGASSPQEALKKWSSSVFSGEVVAINKVAINKEEFTFSVENVWKGILAKEIVIVDSMIGSNCSMGMTMGERYIIFANFLQGKNKKNSVNDQGKPIFQIHPCSWSAPLARPNTQKDIIEKLGKGKSVN